MLNGRPMNLSGLDWRGGALILVHQRYRPRTHYTRQDPLLSAQHKGRNSVFEESKAVRFGIGGS